MSELDAIEIEVMRHLFSSIAEEMGATLMRSAFSPNIKERRDYSCAIFDARARMVSQAAHIPVHLGSTPMSVRAALDAFPDLEAGQHVVLNDPYAGGTHLPDITLVSPVCAPDGRVLFLVANRAHHADVGGISPGSLPLSRSIDDEGIRISPELHSDALLARLMAASRTPDERRGDLLAQIAANLRGAERLLGAIASRGEGRVVRAAGALQDYAERLMRARIARIPDGTWRFEDVLDGDGHSDRPIRVCCELTIEADRAIVDLTECDDQVTGPVNVPRAVSVSAALYAFRCLLGPGAPSNDGVMRPLDVRTRPGSLAHAVYPAAVAAGNVETSQRLTDCILGALALALPDVVPAASCGSMNNVLIGGVDPRYDDGRSYAYYETIAGGAGAGPGFAGASGAHTHMTNTLNTPAEALERAYPFVLERHALRKGSGGAGRWRGGDGVERVYRFAAPTTVTLMTERRDHAPWGLAGGADGATGENVLVRDGVETLLPPKCTLEVDDGDRVIVRTPGGGGWGAPELSDDLDE